MRSSLLKHMPASVSTKKRLSQAKRFVLVFSFAAFIIIPTLIIVIRILPKNGSGYVFYWIHDAIYLPIKAYTYTQFYPFSLSWWGPIALLILVSLFAYLAMFSPTKDLHGQLLRLFLRRPAPHPYLLKTTRQLRKWKMEGLLMQEIAGQERRKALLLLQTHPLTSVPINPIKSLFHLTLFHIQLLLLPPVTKPQYIKAAHMWHQAYQQLRNRLARNPDSEILKDFTTQLAQLAETVLAPLVDWHGPAQLKTAIENPPGFDLPSLFVDLFFLASLYNPNLGQAIKNISQNFPTLVASRLAQSTAARQLLIDKTRVQVEKMITGEIDALYFAKNESQSQWSLLLPAPPFQSLTAELSVAIALDLAAMLPAPALALGYIESIEALDFQLSRLPQAVWEAGFVHVLADLPASPDYAWCAHLAQEELDVYEKAWQQINHGPESPVTTADFQLAHSRVNALYHAAGPDFNREEQ